MGENKRIQQNDKLVLVGLSPKIACHCETSAHTGRGNPPVRGEMYRKASKKCELLRFLVVIVTWFLSTGGLPHQSADWFAMTDNFGRKATNTNLGYRL